MLTKSLAQIMNSNVSDNNSIRKQNKRSLKFRNTIIKRRENWSIEHKNILEMFKERDFWTRTSQKQLVNSMPSKPVT